MIASILLTMAIKNENHAWVILAFKFSPRKKTDRTRIKTNGSRRCQTSLRAEM